MIRKANLKKTIVDNLRDMARGESIWFPASKSGNVRSVTSQYGFQWDRVFKTKTNREDRMIIVTRTV